MKTWIKVLLIVGGVLMACGLILLVAAAAMDGFRGFDLLRYFSPELREVTHEIEEEFTSVRVECVESNVVIRPSEDGTCKVVSDDSEKIYHIVSVKNNILTILRKDDRVWYERIGLFLWRESTVTVWLPAEQYESLVAESVSGDVRVNGISWSSAALESVSGDVISEGLSLTGDGMFSSVSGDVTLRNATGASLRISSVSGDVMISSVSGKTVSADSTSGDLILSDVTAEGDLTLDTVSGDMEFSRCDGSSVSIDTTSGDVSGTLLSPKKFSYDTTSGDIRVPDSSGTDPCVISTTSGDAQIRIVS